VTAIESLRAGIGNRRQHVPLKIDFFTDKLQPYARLVKLLLKLSEREGRADYCAQAFEYAERGRGRGLLDLLAESQALAQIEAPAELVRRAGEANELVAAYEGGLRRELSRPPAIRDQKLIEEFGERLRLAEEERRIAQDQSEEKVPRYVELANVRPVTKVIALRRSLVKVREYDAGTAHPLYEKLFRPLEDR
jgi:hypothetical protein